MQSLLQKIFRRHIPPVRSERSDSTLSRRRTGTSFHTADGEPVENSIRRLWRESSYDDRGSFYSASGEEFKPEKTPPEKTLNIAHYKNIFDKFIKKRESFQSTLTYLFAWSPGNAYSYVRENSATIEKVKSQCIPDLWTNMLNPMKIEEVKDCFKAMAALRKSALNTVLKDGHAEEKKLLNEIEELAKELQSFHEQLHAGRFGRKTGKKARLRRRRRVTKSRVTRLRRRRRVTKSRVTRLRRRRRVQRS